MIKILHPGNDERLKGTKTFLCTECECLFKADKKDYTTDSQYNMTYYTCVCPYCGYKFAHEANL